MTHRQSNRPDRRIIRFADLDAIELSRIASQAVYVGSANHKLHSADYGFHPPGNPRPSKSLCDDRRHILKKEAAQLLQDGIRHGMVSRFEVGQLPKYIWVVDQNHEVYEAKTKPGQENTYHGYRLSMDDGMRAEVLSEWKRRCSWS